MLYLINMVKIGIVVEFGIAIFYIGFIIFSIKAILSSDRLHFAYSCLFISRIDLL